MVAVVWDESGSLMWNISIYLDTDIDGTHQVDHLTRYKAGDNSKWVRPQLQDLQNVYDEQILPLSGAAVNTSTAVAPIKIAGDWDYLGRKPIYVVSN